MFISKVNELLQIRMFFVLLCFNVLSVIKNDIAKILPSIPILTVVGEAGVGKTTLVNLCLFVDAVKMCFSDRAKDIAQNLKNAESGIAFIDDLAAHKAQGIREKNFKILDGIVRNSYTGTGPLIVLTAERAALKRQADSCLQRMIMIEADAVLVGDNLERIKWVRKNREKCCQMMCEFEEWYSEKEFNFEEMLEKFRDKNCLKGSPRQVDLAFSFLASISVFDEFMEQKGYTLPDEMVIDKHISSLISPDCLAEIENGLTIKSIIDEAISEKKIIPQFIVSKEVCLKYLSGKCSKFGFRCDSRCDDWRNGMEKCIAPEELLLNIDEGHNSVLLRDIHEIRNCPKHLPNGPVLIIDEAALKININDVLLHKSIIRKQHIPHWSSISIHKKLYEERMCFYWPNGYDKCRYTCNYWSYDGEQVKTIRVCILRLTQEQYERLVEQTKIYSTMFPTYAVKDINRILRFMNGTVSKLQYISGDVGKSIFEGGV